MTERLCFFGIPGMLRTWGMVPWAWVHPLVKWTPEQYSDSGLLSHCILSLPLPASEVYALTALSSATVSTHVCLFSCLEHKLSAVECSLTTGSAHPVHQALLVSSILACPSYSLWSPPESSWHRLIQLLWVLPSIWLSELLILSFFVSVFKCYLLNVSVLNVMSSMRPVPSTIFEIILFVTFPDPF